MDLGWISEFHANLTGFSTECNESGIDFHVSGVDLGIVPEFHGSGMDLYGSGVDLGI